MFTAPGTGFLKALLPLLPEFLASCYWAHFSKPWPGLVWVLWRGLVRGVFHTFSIPSFRLLTAGAVQLAQVTLRVPRIAGYPGT